MNKKGITSFLRKSLDKLQVVIIFTIMFVFMSIFSPSFFTWTNFTNLIKQNAVLMVLAAGMTGILIVGQTDISVGAIVGLVGVVTGLVSEKGVGFVGCFAIGILTGAAVGFINGVITNKGKIPPFIATLGTQMMCRSLAYVFSEGSIITSYPEGWDWLGQAAVFGGSVPVLLFCAIFVYIITYILHKKTVLGQQMFAVGSNRTAAELSGINTDRVIISIQVYSGILAGFAGILLSSRAMATQADAGTSMEFYAIASTVVGGTSMKGGSGNVLLTIVGVFIIGMIRNALNLFHINVYWQNFVTGFIIVAAVLLDSFRRTLQEKLDP